MLVLPIAAERARADPPFVLVPTWKTGRKSVLGIDVRFHSSRGAAVTFRPGDTPADRWRERTHRSLRPRCPRPTGASAFPRGLTGASFRPACGSWGAASGRL